MASRLPRAASAWAIEVDLAEADRVQPRLPGLQDRRQVRLDVRELLGELGDRGRQGTCGDDDQHDQDAHDQRVDEDRRDRPRQARDDVDDPAHDRADDEREQPGEEEREEDVAEVEEQRRQLADDVEQDGDDAEDEQDAQQAAVARTGLGGQHGISAGPSSPGLRPWSPRRSGGCARRRPPGSRRPGRVRHQRQIAFAGVGVARDDPVGEDLLHVDAAGPRRPLALPQRLVVVAERALELADVADLGPARVGAQDPLRVGDHRHDLLADDLGRGEDVDGVADRLRHLPDAVGAEHGRGLGEDRLRLGERVAVAHVEGADDLARQLEVRGLVLADGHQRRLVDDDVGRLQDGVGEQAVVDVVGLLLALLLVGRRPLEPADRGDGGEQPGELGHLGPVALDEERALVGIETEGQQRGGHLAGSRAQDVGVVRARQRVVVDDAVDRLVLGLEPDVVADGAQVVAEMDDPGRLDAREDARSGGRRFERREGRCQLGRHGSRV